MLLKSNEILLKQTLAVLDCVRTRIFFRSMNELASAFGDGFEENASCLVRNSFKGQTASQSDEWKWKKFFTVPILVFKKVQSHNASLAKSTDRESNKSENKVAASVE